MGLDDEPFNLDDFDDDLDLDFDLDLDSPADQAKPSQAIAAATGDNAKDAPDVDHLLDFDLDDDAVDYTAAMPAAVVAAPVVAAARLPLARPI